MEGQKDRQKDRKIEIQEGRKQNKGRTVKQKCRWNKPNLT